MATGIIEIMKQAAVDVMNATTLCDVVFGKVTKINPLEVQISPSLTISQESGVLKLARQVTDYKTQMSFDNPNIKQVYTTCNMNDSNESSKAKIMFKEPVKHEITIYNSLKVGDTVIMMRMQGGQTFVVLDKIGD